MSKWVYEYMGKSLNDTKDRLFYSYTHILIYRFTHTLIYAYTHILKYSMGFIYSRHDFMCPFELFVAGVICKFLDCSHVLFVAGGIFIRKREHLIHYLVD